MPDSIKAPVLQDKPEDYFRSLLAARGMPIFAGGSPEVDKGTEESSESTEVPEMGQTEEAQESFTDFDPEQIPEDARPHVEALQKQWQANYTKTRQAETQAIAQERQEAQEYRDFITAIQNDPAARDAWLQQEFGYEFEDDGAEEFLDPEEELAARVEQLEGHLTQQQQAELASQQESEITEFVAEEIEGLEKAQGKDFEFSPEELAFISTYAHTHPQPNGTPDVKGANDALSNILDKRQEQWIASKKSGRRISQGSPAKKAFDPTNQEERFKFYDEVAEEAAPSLE
jgi:hypothetical protein